MQNTRCTRQVFQINPPISKVSLTCIESHLHISRNMKYKDRYDYFYSNGIDYDMVERYYVKVVALNENISKTQ